MDEELTQPDVPTVGERLRAAREEKDLSLDDVAAQTRIPLRHLAAIETADWDSLPAPTYTVGFAKSYASAVGLDRTEIGDQLRAEMGGQRFAAATEVFEAADPARTMPKWLVLGGVAAIFLLVVVMSLLNRRSLENPEQPQANASAVATAPAPAPRPAATPAAAPSAQGPVVLTATDAVWLQVSQKGGATLFSGTLQPGQTFAVPATASAPVLKTGKPEALKITIGNAVAPPVGPPATTVTNVSLLGPDLMKGPKAATPAPPPAAPKPRPRKPAAATAPTAPPPTETPPTTNTGE